MASTSLALPGVLFVGEDDRARLVAHLGPASGWMIPKGVLGWSTEVSVVTRDALSEQVRRDLKIVMPEEQIAAAKLPLTHQAALKSPLVSVSSRLTQKLIDSGIRVHTVGADRVTSSFYYIAEGGGEAPARVEGDLVAAAGAMLGEKADNAAIDRVLDGLADRLLRSLSKDRVTELSLELAAALPRAAADGSGTQDLDLDAFEKELASLIGASEKYKPFLQDIASKLEATNDRKVDIPLYGDARKVSQAAFELAVGDQTVNLLTHDRWLATGPLTEPPKAAPAPAPAPAATAKAAPAPTPQKAPEPKAATPKPAPAAAAAAAPAASPPPANMKPLASPINPPRPASNPPPKEVTPAPKEAAPITPSPVLGVGAPAAAAAPAPAPEPAPAPAKVEAPVEAPAPAPAPKEEPKVEVAAKVEPKAEPKVEPKAEPKVEPKAEPKSAAIEAKQESVPAERDRRNAMTQKVPRQKEGGLPWFWILLGVALAAFAAYQFGLIKH